MLLLFTFCLHVYCLSYINKYIIIFLTFMLFDLFITNQTKIISLGMRTILQGVHIKINIWTLVIFIIKNGSYVKMGNPTFYSNTAFSYLIWIIYDNSWEQIWNEFPIAMLLCYMVILTFGFIHNMRIPVLIAIHKSTCVNVVLH